MLYRRKSRKSAKTKRSYKPSQKAKKYNYRSVRRVKDVKKIVRRIINDDTETKQQVMDWTLNPLCLQNTTSGLGGNYVVLNPSNATLGSYTINRGVGSGQMSGDKIRVKSAIMNYVIIFNNYNASSNTQLKPTYVRAFIYKYKKAPLNDPQVGNICGTGINANFFELGTSDVGFIGNLEDLNQRMNRDAYTYYSHKTWKIGPMIAPSGATQTPVYTYSNNDFKYSVFGKWNVTKFLPKILTRDDDGVWMDPYVVCMFQILSADGTTLGSTQQPIKVDLSLQLKYTDS